ncbi:MAG: hypothetical protein ACRELE_06540 [Gemmatimonadales bacterium]
MAHIDAAQLCFELRELATGKVQSWQDIQSVTFAPTSSHLLLRRRPSAAGGAGTTGVAPGPVAPAGGGGRGGAGSAPDGKGTDAILHDLATGRSLFLGSVDDVAFNRSGELLAYTVGAAVRDGNGLFVIDLASGTIHVLDNDATIYSRLAFTDDGKGIAVLKGRDVPKMREPYTVLVAIPDVRAAFGTNGQPAGPVVLDPSVAAGFPKGFVLSDRAALSWSDDHHRVFVGMMPETAAPDTARRTTSPRFLLEPLSGTEGKLRFALRSLRAHPAPAMWSARSPMGRWPLSGSTSS